MRWTGTAAAEADVGDDEEQDEEGEETVDDGAENEKVRVRMGGTEKELTCRKSRNRMRWLLNGLELRRRQWKSRCS